MLDLTGLQDLLGQKKLHHQPAGEPEVAGESGVFQYILQQSAFGCHFFHLFYIFAFEESEVEQQSWDDEEGDIEKEGVIDFKEFIVLNFYLGGVG